MRCAAERRSATSGSQVSRGDKPAERANAAPAMRAAPGARRAVRARERRASSS